MEILVVVAITALLSGLVISYSRFGHGQVALFAEAQKVSGYIFRAKSLALATYNNPSLARSCGYGVAIDYATRSYILFSYEPQPQPPNCRAIDILRGDFQVEISREKLNERIVFKSSDPDSLNAVLFVPPAPTTLVSVDPSGVLSNVSGKVYLESGDGAASTAVTVNLAGQISL